MNIPSFAIPGLMPVPSPKADAHHEMPDDGSVVLTVLCEPASDVVKLVTFRILDEAYREQFKDIIGLYVYREIIEGRRKYKIKTPASTLKLAGAYRLITYVDDNPGAEFYVVRKSNGFSEWRRNGVYWDKPENGRTPDGR